MLMEELDVVLGLLVVLNNKNQNVYGVLIKISVSLHIFDFSSSNVAVLDDS